MQLREQYEKILNFGKESESQRFSIPELTNSIRQLVWYTDFRFFTKRDKGLSKNTVVVGGLYDPHDDQIGLPSISIYLTYPAKQRYIKIKDLDWPQVTLKIVECVGHELVHQEQYRARDYDIGPNIFVSSKEDKELRESQEYLGSTDEIEAYGYSIAAEIFLSERPEKISGKHVVKTELYKSYVTAFGSNHIVVRNLLENVLKYYKRLITTGE